LTNAQPTDENEGEIDANKAKPVHVDIQQEYGHGNSSRSWLTNSGVTITALDCTGRSGMPLRMLVPDAGGRSGCGVVWHLNA
jgi:hypothetical protein